MALTYTPIATTTLNSTAASVTFSSISASYTDLVLVMDAISSVNFTNTNIVINGDTGTNYSWTIIKGDGSTTSSSRSSNTAKLNLGLINQGRGAYKISFQNYSNTTTFKSIISAGGLAGNRVEYGVGLWRSTSAINSIQIVQGPDTFAATSTFNLYGILKA